MHRLIIVLLALSSSLLLTQQVAAASLRILYTGPHFGELEPSASAKGVDLGGLRRLASLVDSLRGDSTSRTMGKSVLISTGGLLGTNQPAHRVTNRFLLQGIAALEYDAIGLQWQDLIYGVDELTAEKLPWVVSNWRQTDRDAAARSLLGNSRLIQAGDLQVGFLSWLDPEASPHQAQAGNHSPVHADIAVLERQLNAFKGQSVFTIVAATDVDRLLSQLPSALVNLVLTPASDEAYSVPEKRDQTWILSAGTRGQGLGDVTLGLDSAGAWQVRAHSVHVLDEASIDAKRLDSWFERYEAALVEDNAMREQAAKTKRADSEYVGDKQCGLCHSRQKAQWETTGHARAYQSLVAVTKQFDANCVGCHVVGFGQAGGFYSAQAEPDLRNVSCEACHGPAKRHLRSGGTKPLTPVTQASCTGCHNNEHSPDFDLNTYWPAAAHQPKP